MASSTLSPGTMANDSSNGGTTVWTNVDNAKVSDNAYASLDPDSNASQYLLATNFGFAIPAGSVITGVEVILEAKAAGLGVIGALRLVKGGTIQSTAKSTPAITSETSYTTPASGGSTDLWGNTWTVDEVNNSGFGCALTVANLTSNDTDVDLITMTVYYTVTSVSPSRSPSVSVSISPSISQSLSPSRSLSVSPSTSPSASISPSISPSVSPSQSPSTSQSVSPSQSQSVSPSTSPSQSPSSSISPSTSPSISLSVSPSVSPSISIPMKPHVRIVDKTPVRSKIQSSPLPRNRVVSVE